MVAAIVENGIADIVAFGATNIDDYVILIVLFARAGRGMTNVDVVVGQFLGFTIINLTSLLGLVVGLFVPEKYIGLMGFIPILFGLYKLYELIKERYYGDEDEQAEQPAANGDAAATSAAAAAVAIATPAAGAAGQANPDADPAPGGKPLRSNSKLRARTMSSLDHMNRPHAVSLRPVVTIHHAPTPSDVAAEASSASSTAVDLSHADVEWHADDAPAMPGSTRPSLQLAHAAPASAEVAATAGAAPAAAPSAIADGQSAQAQAAHGTVAVDIAATPTANDESAASAAASPPPATPSAADAADNGAEEAGEEEEEEGCILRGIRRVMGPCVTKGALSSVVLTLANSGDNVAVYLPIFASTGPWGIVEFIVIFYILLSLWCIAAWATVNVQWIADFLEKYGELIVPFCLMAIGVWVLDGSVAWVF